MRHSEFVRPHGESSNGYTQEAKGLNTTPLNSSSSSTDAAVLSVDAKFFRGRVYTVQQRTRAALDLMPVLPGIQRHLVLDTPAAGSLGGGPASPSAGGGSSPGGPPQAGGTGEPGSPSPGRSPSKSRQAKMWRRRVNVLDLSCAELSTRNTEHLFATRAVPRSTDVRCSHNPRTFASSPSSSPAAKPGMVAGAVENPGDQLHDSSASSSTAAPTNLTHVLVDFKQLLRLNVSGNAAISNLCFLRYGFPILEELVFDDCNIDTLAGLESKCQTLIKVCGDGNSLQQVLPAFSHHANGREFVVVYGCLQYLSLRRNPLESFILCKVGGNKVAAKLLPSLVELYVDIVRTKKFAFHREYAPGSSSDAAKNFSAQKSADFQEPALLADSPLHGGDPTAPPADDLTDEPENFLTRKVLVYIRNLPRLWVLQLSIYDEMLGTGFAAQCAGRGGSGSPHRGSSPTGAKPVLSALAADSVGPAPLLLTTLPGALYTEMARYFGIRLCGGGTGTGI